VHDSSVASFSSVSRVVAVGDGTFRADVSAAWGVENRPNGGYLTAMIARAAGAVSSHPHVLAASATFVRSPEPGPVTITVEQLRAGRSASQFRGRLSQGERPCVEALLTLGTLSADATPYWDGGLPEPGDVPYEAGERLDGLLPDGRQVSILEHVAVRLDPASAGFVHKQPGGTGELRGWLTLPGDEPFDPVSLLYAVDSFPPGTVDLEPSGWVPTLELTAYVRALPAPGPVRVLQQARLIEDHRVDEACFVWDRTGRLVAQSTQLALIRLG
jgi:acyl-CoA thioesterase